MREGEDWGVLILKKEIEMHLQEEDSNVRTRLILKKVIEMDLQEKDRNVRTKLIL